MCVVEKDMVAKATMQGYLVGTVTASCRRSVRTGCGWNEVGGSEAPQECASEILEVPPGQNLFLQGYSDPAVPACL